jgi:hypothetical protein
MAKKTMKMPADQASDCQTQWAAGPPSSRARTAATVTLSGWFVANPWSQLGIVATGTIALLANVRMKKGGMPARGEIAAECELDLVPDILIGLNILRILLGDIPDREYISRVLNTIIHPLVTGQPRR